VPSRPLRTFRHGFDESNPPGLIARLDRSGFQHGEPEDVTASRILLLHYLDGNRVVLSTALTDD
jgi:hypothetical protein